VQLRSLPSPDMVVDSVTWTGIPGTINDDDQMSCLWFDEHTNQFRREKFSRCVLIEVE
jgi:hypothetical protein